MSDTPNKNTSGEKDFIEIDQEIKNLIIEGKSPDESKIQESSQIVNNIDANLLIKSQDSIWNDQINLENQSERFNMKFMNRNKIVLRNDNKFSNQYSHHKTESQEIVLEEEIPTNVVSNIKIKSNNLNLIDKMSLSQIRSFTDPPEEEQTFKSSTFCSPFVKEKFQQRLFPVIENTNNRDDSIDSSNLLEENESSNLKCRYNEISPRLIMNKSLVSNFSTNESNIDKIFNTPSNENSYRDFYYEPRIYPQDALINTKASSFCNPSEYHLNKHAFNFNQEGFPQFNFPNNNNLSKANLSKMFSSNYDKTKKKAGRDQQKNDNFTIVLDKILRLADRRTTLMIKNIPNKYNTRSLLEEINYNFKAKYDFFYLPLDFYNNCNLGFAFINLVDPLHVLLFHHNFNGQRWKKFKSDKICEITYAKFQGKNELISHFEKSNVMSTLDDNKKPLVFINDHIPKVELPFKYIEVLNDYYPKCNYHVSNGKIVLDSLFQ